MNRPALVICALAAAAALAAGGCAQDATQDIEGVTWVLSRYEDGSGEVVGVLDGTRVDAYFSDGSVSGTGGCNSYSGEYTSSDGSIEIGALVQTEIFCMEPEGVMDQEAAFFQAMSRASSYRLEDSSLVLEDEEGGTLAVFEPE